MKAIQYRRFGGPEVLEFVDVPDPTPGPEEVLIEATAIGVNYSDTLERLGTRAREEMTGHLSVLPHIGGLQVVGYVLRSGGDAHSYLVGRKVMALMRKGAYAQRVVARADMLVELADDTNDMEMAGLPAQGVTAYLALQVCATLRRGESVLVHGATGGIGSFAVQVARMLGASQIIGTASTEAKRAFVLALGADVAIGYDYRRWPETVLDYTEGRGVDIIIETIGGDVFDQNFECLGMLGRCVVIGSTQRPGATLEPRRLMGNAQSLTGIHLQAFFRRPDMIQRGLHFLREGVAQGLIRPLVAAVIPLSRTADAHSLLDRHQARGVIVLDPRM